jgi:hypothetical protein
MKAEDGPIRDEYDFTNSRKNPYAERANAGVKLVVIEPDLYERFPSTEAVNSALRGLLEDADRRVKTS